MARTLPPIVPPSFPAVVLGTETHAIAVRVAAPRPAAAVRLAARAWRDSKANEAFAIDKRRIDRAGARNTHIRVTD